MASLASAGTYYFRVHALTPADDVIINQEQESPTEVPVFPAFSEYTIYGPVLLFFALFISAFGLLIVHHARTDKTIISAAVIALFAASIPTLLAMIGSSGTLVVTRAGPDEVPRDVAAVAQAADTALVSWMTDSPQRGGIAVSVAPFDPQRARMIIADGGTKTTVHTAIVDELEPATEYEVMILSGGQWYDNDGVPLRLTSP